VSWYTNWGLTELINEKIIIAVNNRYIRDFPKPEYIIQNAFVFRLRSRFIFVKRSVRISVGTPAVLRVFHGLPQPFRANYLL
jgi:hypothetical protein